MSDKTYNGWTNYETWLIKLWMDNSEGDQNYWQEETEIYFRDAIPNHPFTRSEKAKLTLAAALKDRHEEHYLEVLRHAKQECSWMSDLIGAAMSEVNWHEIADSLLTNHCEEYSKEESVAA